MDHYDVIVIGSGAGGATVTYSLAPTGKRILLLERGDFLTREVENWSPQAIWADARYQIQCCDQVLEGFSYRGGRLGIGGVAHQSGTIRFGDDRATSALDLSCRLHDLDNVYVTDSSFFVSSTSVNPTLTIIANAGLSAGDSAVCPSATCSLWSRRPPRYHCCSASYRG